MFASESSHYRREEPVLFRGSGKRVGRLEGGEQGPEPGVEREEVGKPGSRVENTHRTRAVPKRTT